MPFPDVNAPLQPSDALPPSAATPVPLVRGLPRCGRLCCAPQGRRHVRPPRAVRRRPRTGSPKNRDGSRRGEGLPGYGAVLFVRALVEHPAGYNSLLAQFTQGVIVAFDEIQHARHPGRREVSGPQSHGPHVRTPTLRRPGFPDRRQAGYRLGRAHPWPDGFRTRWTTHNVSCSHRILQFPLTRRAWSHWNSYPLY